MPLWAGVTLTVEVAASPFPRRERLPFTSLGRQNRVIAWLGNASVKKSVRLRGHGRALCDLCHVGLCWTLLHFNA